MTVYGKLIIKDRILMLLIDAAAAYPAYKYRLTTLLLNPYINTVVISPGIEPRMFLPVFFTTVSTVGTPTHILVGY